MSVLGTYRSKKKPYQQNMGDEEGFQISFSGSSHCDVCAGAFSSRAEHHESVFLASFMYFPGVAASICLHNMHRLSCDFAQDNQA